MHLESMLDITERMTGTVAQELGSMKKAAMGAQGEEFALLEADPMEVSVFYIPPYSSFILFYAFLLHPPWSCLLFKVEKEKEVLAKEKAEVEKAKKVKVLLFFLLLLLLLLLSFFPPPPPPPPSCTSFSLLM